jgi:hypothetical protein
MPRTRSTTSPASRRSRSGGNVDQTALLLTMLGQIKDDMAREQEAARENRAKLHERIDDIVARIGSMETTVALAGEVDAQVRRELDGLNRRVHDELGAMNRRLDPERGDIGSTVAAWNDMLKTGRRISWLLGIAGITSIGTGVALIGGAWDAIKAWLRMG